MHRHEGKVDDADSGPQLPASLHQRKGILSEGQRLRTDDGPVTYSTDGSLYAFRVLSVDCCEERNERRNIDHGTYCLIQYEFLRCIGLVERARPIRSCDISRKRLFKILLPEKVRWTCDQSEHDELRKGHEVEGKRILLQISQIVLAPRARTYSFLVAANALC